MAACSSSSSTSQSEDAGINYDALCSSNDDCTGGGICRFGEGCSPDLKGICAGPPAKGTCAAAILCSCEGTLITSCSPLGARYSGGPVWVNNQPTCPIDGGATLSTGSRFIKVAPKPPIEFEGS